MEATERLLLAERAPDNSDRSDGPADDGVRAAESAVVTAHEDGGETASAGEENGFSHAGSMLKAARESMGLDIRSISERINVKAERLAAIEDLEVSALPAPTFTLGFVRSYARTLNLPEDALVERFRRDAGYPAPRQTPVLDTRPAKDLGATPRVNLLAVLGLILGVLWITWQLLQSSAPDTVAASSDLTDGIPLVERARTATGVTYEVETRLADSSALDTPLTLPSADTPIASGNQADGAAASNEVIVPVNVADLERALEAGESEARTAALENIRQAETGAAAEGSSASETDAEADAPAADDAATETVASDEGENDTLVETADVSPSANDLNAEALNQLALRAVAEADERAAAGAAALAEPDLPVEGVTADGIEIVAGDAADIAGAVTVAAERTPAAVRTAIEPVYPSRCESEAAETETVTIRYTVSRYGKVVSPEAVGSTNPCFNRAAIAAVSRWDFFPAEEGGATVTDAGRTSRVVFQRPR